MIILSSTSAALSDSFYSLPERRTVNVKTGSVLVPSEQAEAVKIAETMDENCEVHQTVLQMIENCNTSSFC
ncbi:MAG: hypothetical protein IJ583_03740 [Firmicutes bacterium]|nr:hypothetical protein [Bacillota bacterium]